MIYKEFINNILETRGRFGITEGYKERHHIVPRCLNGADDEDNLIDLYAREHFIAHKLLADENKDNFHLQFAYVMMATMTTDKMVRYELTPEEYEEAKIRKSIVSSESQKNKIVPDGTKLLISESLKRYYANNPVTDEGREIRRNSQIKRWEDADERDKQCKIMSEYYKTHSVSEDTRFKMSESRKGYVPTEEARKNMSNASKRLWEDHEYREKQKESHKNIVVSEEMRLKHSLASKGRKHTKESKDKISKGNTGKKRSAESKKLMSEKAKERAKNPEYIKKLKESHKGQIPWNKGLKKKVR